ncbi:MAG TPA: sugar-transfer associated ATP-grasp domain-containing protein [Woeseiaceae bacterium]|nr:sugar-transfer associated ATP-grasp domain-containing protein [Woeseiaceae bacterium]
MRQHVATIRALITDPMLSQSYYPEHERKSKLAVLVDLIGPWLRYGEVNTYYYLYGLDRLDANKKDILPYSLFRTLRDSRNLRPTDLPAYSGTSYNFICVLRDKFLFSTFAAGLGIPASKSLAICSRDSVFWIRTGQRMPLEQLLDDTSLNIDGMVKPIDGIMGSNVFPMKVIDGRLYIDGVKASIDDLRTRLTRRHLLDVRIKQHTDIAELHPWSINTLRLVTFNQGGHVELLSSTFRIGTGRRPTDNWSAGGILIAVDPGSGTTRGDGYLKPSYGQRVRRHPDTGIELEGLAIPNYDRAVATVLRLHTHLPGLHSIGWDVAITPDGPVVIEGNDDWDGAVPMAVEPGFRQRLMRMY